MKTISVFDTSILSYNIGNEIIMDSVMSQLNKLFSEDFIIRIPIDDIGTVSRRYNRLSTYTFVGGTNALNGDIRKYHQWDLNLHNILILKNIILMGCGWFQYEKLQPTKYTRWAFSRILSTEYIHSVRDNYTLLKCQNLNIPNTQFINTGCPTLWELTPSHTSSISKKKSDSVIFTITDYNTVPERDRYIVDVLKSNYSKIYFFPQGRGDLNYLSSLNLLKDLQVVSPRLQEFDRILETEVDYVGTRLHAGIRALQKKCRSIIIGIDNRSLEMQRDFKIPVLNQTEIESLKKMINQDYNVELSIPWDNIKEWKSQFIKRRNQL